MRCSLNIIVEQVEILYCFSFYVAFARNMYVDGIDSQLIGSCAVHVTSKISIEDQQYFSWKEHVEIGKRANFESNRLKGVEVTKFSKISHAELYIYIF